MHFKSKQRRQKAWDDGVAPDGNGEVKKKMASFSYGYD